MDVPPPPPPLLRPPPPHPTTRRCSSAIFLKILFICVNDIDCIDYYLFKNKNLEKKNVTLDPRHGTLALDMKPSTLDKKIDSPLYPTPI